MPRWSSPEVDVDFAIAILKSESENFSASMIGDRRSDQAANLPVVTQSEAADLYHVSERIERADVVLPYEDLADQVRRSSGTVSCSSPVRLANVHSLSSGQRLHPRRAMARSAAVVLVQ
jgi:hypothetical protein